MYGLQTGVGVLVRGAPGCSFQRGGFCAQSATPHNPTPPPSAPCGFGNAKIRLGRTFVNHPPITHTHMPMCSLSIYTHTCTHAYTHAHAHGGPTWRRRTRVTSPTEASIDRGTAWSTALSTGRLPATYSVVASPIAKCPVRQVWSLAELGPWQVWSPAGLQLVPHPVGQEPVPSQHTFPG